MLGYVAQEFTPPNTVYVNQKVPSQLWVPGSYTISFSSHGVFSLLKIHIRSENHQPFLNSEVGYGEEWGRHTHTQRGNSQIQNTQKTTQKRPLQGLYWYGVTYQGEVPGWC